MPQVPESRRVGRVAVSQLRLLLEDQGHIVQEIDGSNDHGEDLHITFVQDGQRTNDSVAVQVKGGASHRARQGHRVKVGDHADNWRNSSVPVLCVVHDPEPDVLFWANATRQLRRAMAQRKTLKSIVISRDSVLNAATVAGFVKQARRYVALEREGLGRWADMAGVEFGERDIVKPFENEAFEPMVFWQRRGEPFATLLHHDLDWEPEKITPDMLGFGVAPDHLPPEIRPTAARLLQNVPTIGNVILDMAEAMWLAACFDSTAWYRRPETV